MNTVVTQASGANQAHLRAHEAVVDARHLRGQRFLRRGARVDLLHGHVRHRPDKLGTSRLTFLAPCGSSACYLPAAN